MSTAANNVAAITMTVECRITSLVSGTFALANRIIKSFPSGQLCSVASMEHHQMFFLVSLFLVVLLEHHPMFFLLLSSVSCP